MIDDRIKHGPLKHGMPPIARGDARLFILGSLPGDASLAARRYYAHRTNQFWRLLGGAIGEDLHGRTYEERLACLANWRIGLWDVVASAARRGSLDQAIRDADHNSLASLANDFPDLEAIAFNGKTAAEAGRRLLPGGADVALIDLPSSSAANTIPLNDKLAAWSGLARFCGA